MSDETPTVETDVANLALGGLLTPPKEKPPAHDEYPGKINVATERGHANGCAFMEFTDGADAGPSAWKKANDYFAEHPNRLIMDIKYSQVPVEEDDSWQIKSSILVLFTKVLSQAELDEFQSVQVEARRLMDLNKAKNLAAEMKLEEEQRAKEAEEKRLLEVGRKCEKNHKKDK